jgi:hypothetical protein
VSGFGWFCLGFVAGGIGIPALLAFALSRAFDSASRNIR